jgi:ribosomal protein L37AE/L43A
MRPPTHEPECTECGESYDQRRAALGYSTCLDCGDVAAASERASWCIAPAGHKQGETLVRDPSHLKQINKYAAG